MARNDYFSGVKSKKGAIEQPFSPCYHFSIFLYTITQNSILSRKLIYKHENSGQFPCLYHIPRLSTAFSVKLIRLSAKTANILLLFTFPFYTITETPDFCVKVYFCLIVRFFPLSPSYQRHPKTKKLGSTTHRDEPHQALKPLILSHSSILSPTSTQIPMASIQDCRLCRCQSCDRYPEWRTGYIIESDIMAELNGGRIAAVLTADTAVDRRSCLLALFDRHLH